MKKQENGDNNFWSEGSFAETMGSKEIKEKMRTFHMNLRKPHRLIKECDFHIDRFHL